VELVAVRDVFERAILEHPDDVAGYAAYADWLQEQGDPRGEFIQVQLALEDETKLAGERKRLRARETALLEAHERVWLGDLSPYLTGRDLYSEFAKDMALDHRWRYGYLAGVTVPYLTMTSAQALATSPVAAVLRELRVQGLADYWAEPAPDRPPARAPTPAGVRDHCELFELIGAPCLRNLRVFQMGEDHGGWPDDGVSACYAEVPGLEHVVAGIPRVEELHLLCKAYDFERIARLPTLTRLRVLKVYHLGANDSARYRRREAFPLDLLAQNPSLAGLTHLLFHPHYPERRRDGQDLSFLPLDQVRALVRSKHLTSLTYLQLRLSDMGDDGVREIIDSGILKRLKVLDLRHGCITDDGARLFAACPDARSLERLDLSRNAVTAAGLRALKAAGIKAVANSPLTRRELDAREFLHEGDFE
jgi:uncharacterized protein (TIGR02996 family)